MSFTFFEIEFTRDGQVFDEAQVAKLLGAADGFTDLIVLSHGWNNNKAEASDLYEVLCANLAQVVAANVVSDLAGREFGVLRVFWPSKRFDDADLIPGGGAASADVENEKALLRVLEEMKRDPARLGGSETSTVRSSIDAAQRLVPRLETDETARREFVLHLRAVLDPAAAHPDDGTEEFFARAPEQIFNSFSDAVPAPAATGGGGGATSVGDAGGAAGVGDLLSGFKAAARRIANFTTYCTMKQRAGLVGSTGLARVLRQLRDQQPDLRLHLVGHSFGGRLVTAAANALPVGTPAVTMTLLQAAFSHNGLARKFDGRNDGAFRDVIAQARISGPILITHTKNDRAVGIAYPLASRLSRDQAAALGDKEDPYGGMGRNGAQHMGGDVVEGDLQLVGGSYTLAPGKVFNLKADASIKDHGDVTGPEVAYALLSVVRTV